MPRKCRNDRESVVSQRIWHGELLVLSRWAGGVEMDRHRFVDKAVSFVYVDGLEPFNSVAEAFHTILLLSGW